MSQQDDQTQQRLHIYHAVRQLRVEQKLSDEQVIAYFRKKGLKATTAQSNLRLYYQVEGRRLRRNASRDLVGGLMIGAAGLILPAVHSPLSDASLVIQAFMPAAGAILLLYGAYNLIKAFQYLRR